MSDFEYCIREAIREGIKDAMPGITADAVYEAIREAVNDAFEIHGYDILIAIKDGTREALKP